MGISKLYIVIWWFDDKHCFAIVGISIYNFEIFLPVYIFVYKIILRCIYVYKNWLFYLLKCQCIPTIDPLRFITLRHPVNIDSCDNCQQPYDQ